MLLLNASAGKHVRAYRSSQIILPNGVHKESDFLFQAVLAQHLPPQFVGEVAYGNELYAVLKEELVQHTLVGGAKIAYGVKVDLPKDLVSCFFEGTTVDIQLMTGSVRFNLHELQEHIWDLLKNIKANFIWFPLRNSFEHDKDVDTKSLQKLLLQIG
ncbi:hypothetical protein SELMODRAFT_406176 [Selaginella moellendorffii]|uniref:Uncharacterized protein n=1 Tax=Selaginella moellendorffii TaxID=88036 RepID=D8R1I2_SELML|nr:hypothetical protein SELMODRAFT_406176 [Selaginella moellendorffii]